MQKSDILNVSKTTESYLGSTCGACSVVCSENAIIFKTTPVGLFIPEIDKTHCINCQKCVKVCPGEVLSDELFDKLQKLDDFTRGEILNSYVGRSKISLIYNNSQSGGALTTVLIYLLENGIIDAAIVVKMIPGSPPYPQVILTDSKEEILASQKSKYAPVPLLSVVREIKKFNGKVAFVGLPCHVHGLYNLMKIYPWLRERIEIVLGLICDGLLTYRAIDYFVERAGRKEKRSSIIYKDKFNEDYIKAHVNVYFENESYIIPNWERFELKKYITPPRCKICFDRMNMFSDITFGDPWGIKGIDEKRGESLLLVRTQRGKDIIKKMMGKNYLVLRPVDVEEVLYGQKIPQKKRIFLTFWKAYRNLGFVTPEYLEFIVSKLEKKINITQEEVQNAENYVRQFVKMDSWSEEKVLKFLKKKLFMKRTKVKIKKSIKKLLGM